MMKAMLLTGIRSMEIRETPRPEIKKDIDVLLKVAAEEPDRIWISEKPADDFEQSFTWDFPKHSVTILQLHKHEGVN